MLRRKPEREWERFGQAEPYYGVLSRERFRRQELNDGTIREFFQSGEEHVEFVMRTIRAHVAPDFKPARALDFGCGVGRCTMPIALVSGFAVGADISPSMLREARKRCSELSLSNLEFVRITDGFWETAQTFDLIHSSLVFQHIHPRRGEAIFTRLIHLLEEGGVGCVQFPYERRTRLALRVLGRLRGRLPLLHNLANLVHGNPFRAPLMEKHCYNLNRLIAVLHRNLCGNVHLALHGKGEFGSVVVFFQKKWEEVPHDRL